MTVDPELLTPRDAGLIVGVGAERIRQLDREGKLPAAVRASSGMRLFRKEDVEKFASERRLARQ